MYESLVQLVEGAFRGIGWLISGEKHSCAIAESQPIEIAVMEDRAVEPRIMRPFPTLLPTHAPAFSFPPFLCLRLEC
jgi:hypothetical protein